MLQIKKKPLGAYRCNCYVLIRDGKSVIIDPGFAPEKIEKMIAGTECLGIMLTHGHIDHIGAIKQLVKKHGFPIYMSKKEEPLRYYKKPVPPGYYRDFELDYFDLPEGDFQLGDFHFEIISTPGHSKGSVLIRLGQHLFTGDTLFKGTIGRTDIFQSDPKEMAESIEKIKKLDPSYIVYPGHSETTTLAEEFRSNPFYNGQWEVEE